MASTILFRSVSSLSFETLRHIHAISSFFILSSHSLQSPTKLFQAAFYSTLKTPISPHLSFEITPVARFLVNDCGFSLHDAINICTRKPDLLRHKSYDKSRQILLCLRDKGFHEIGVRKLFFNHPTMIRFRSPETVKRSVEFLEKIGFTGQKLFRVLNRNPAILCLNISRTMEPRVCFLQSVLDPKLAAAVSNQESDEITGKLVSNHSLTLFVISRNPRILLTPAEKILMGFVKNVEEMGIEKGSKMFARVFVQLSMYSRDTLKRKFENLKELGFTEDEVGVLLKKFPTLLGLSEDRLRQNLMFLLEEWKLPRNAILIYPSAMGFSREKRLKPRLIAVKALMMKNQSSQKAESYLPVKFMRMSDGDFHRQVLSRLQVAT